jgi:cytochrome o ubiquinol oxidase operon protein cyoD
MSKTPQTEIAPRGTLASYVTGFLVSVYLTVTAYLAVAHHLFNGWTLGLAISGLAVIQLVVQLVFFLHLGRGGSRSRWNLLVFLFMLIVVIIVVAGSLWIMANLNYRMQFMSPADTNSMI